MDRRDVSQIVLSTHPLGPYQYIIDTHVGDDASLAYLDDIDSDADGPSSGHDIDLGVLLD